MTNSQRNFFLLTTTNLQIFACQTAKENENLYICECSFRLHLTMSRHGKKAKQNSASNINSSLLTWWRFFFLLHALLTCFATPLFFTVVVSWLRKKSKTATNMGQFDINTLFYNFFKHFFSLLIFSFVLFLFFSTYCWCTARFSKSWRKLKRCY
jgi:hypothetical protein